MRERALMNLNVIVLFIRRYFEFLRILLFPVGVSFAVSEVNAAEACSLD